jgi:hypothetical protein
MVTRNVRGVLFLDYVRMIRGQKDIDWSAVLEPDDHVYVLTRVEPDAWYPMPVFERLGNAICRCIAQNQMDAVRMWGHLSVEPLVAKTPELVVRRDPIETLMRMRVLRSTFFDFEALEIPTLVADHAGIVISYQMGPAAEEAASFQTMGFFTRLLELASATNVQASFKERSWAGDARTLLEMQWKMAGSSDASELRRRSRQPIDR